jgi:glycosyltransferase involved in cell wall biosynthesis
MKVVYVVSLFPCWSETFIVREIRALRRRGVDVAIVSLKQPEEELVQPDAAELVDSVVYPKRGLAGIVRPLVSLLRSPVAVVPVVAVAVRSLWRSPVQLGKTLVALWRVLGAASELDGATTTHVHAHWATYPSSAALLLARYLDVPFSFTSHAHDIFVHDHFVDFKLRAAAFAVTISGYNRRLLEQRHGAEAVRRVAVVHCGVDVGDFDMSPETRAEPVLLAVGRLDAIKGFEYLIDACAVLRQRGVAFVCEIVGEGPLRSAFERHIRDLGLGDRVLLRGALPQSEVRAAMRRAAVFAMPSVRTARGDQDGIPVVLMEAMAVGAPVVATAVSGIPELVHDGRTGLVVPERDARSLAAAVERLLCDAALARRLAHGARAMIEAEFDADREGGKVFAQLRSATT